MPPDSIPAPWKGFLQELNELVRQEQLAPIELHCLGGFVVSVVYSFPRPTADLDVVAVVPHDQRSTLNRLASEGSELHSKHHVHLEIVNVAHYPVDYDTRLEELAPGSFSHLRLRVFDPYDLALSKLDRNTEKDRADVLHLAREAALDIDILRRRYNEEYRPYIPTGPPERSDRTLELWIAMIREARQDD